MTGPRLAFLIFNFNAVKDEEKAAFLEKLDSSLTDTAIIIVDSSYPETEYGHLRLVQFSHSPNIGDTMRLGLSAAINLGAEKIATFDSYSVDNATWFLQYVNGGNLIMSRKRGFKEMVVTEVSNLLSFGNAYNGFSLNRIYTREAAEILKETRLNNRAFLVESVNLLNSRNIPTTELIKDGYEGRKNTFKIREGIESIIKSFNKSSGFYSIFSSLAYIINLIAVYVSLSFGMLYPVAILVAGEISGLSNFMMNEKLNFKNRGFLSSAYRLGRFNALLLGALTADIAIVSVIARYSYNLGKGLFTTISLLSIVTVSTVSLFLMNKFVWSKENHRRVYLED